MRVDDYVMYKRITSLWITLCTTVGFIPFYVTHEENEVVMNDFHGGACGGHLFGLSTTPKILRVGYFWPSIFKYCVSAVKKCHPFKVFAWNMCSHPTPLHLIITAGPFTKWGLDFIDCNLASAGGASS